MSASLPDLFARPTCERFAVPAPAGRLLSNGRYTTLVTARGAGVSRCGAYALTRWSGDRVEDRSGFFIWVRDRVTGEFFSVGAEPSAAGATRLGCSWSPGRFTLEREQDGLVVRVEIAVDPASDAELRRVTIRDSAGRARSLDVTTCAEVVLNHPDADAAHPAFSKLFVQTECEPSLCALLARRRPRSNAESHPWLAHALLEPGAWEYETDRTRFVGRGRTYAEPRALAFPAPLSGTTGNVLDPVVALRRAAELPAGGEITLTFALALGEDRASALAAVAGLAADPAGTFERAAEHARSSAVAAGLQPGDAPGLQALAAALVYAHPGLRAPGEQLERAGAQPGLAARLGLAASRPLVLAWLENDGAANQLAELLTARSYWLSLGLEVDVLALSAAPLHLPATDGAIVASFSDFTSEELDALAALAHVVVSGPLRDLAAAALAGEQSERPLPLTPPQAHTPVRSAATARLEPLLEFNGHGGFSADGREYVIRMPYAPGEGPRRPPLPWTNVIANEHFGFLVSETGSGNTWSVNSREHRLTPWHNDALLDPHHEALFVRDEETGAFGSPTPGPCPFPADYEVRHGFGSTTWRHESNALAHEVVTFAHLDQPVRLTRWRLTNTGSKARRLSLWSYQRLVLGVLPELSGRAIVTAYDAAARVLFARNPLAGEFAGRVAFAASVTPAPPSSHSVTTDRDAFVGAGCSTAAPRAVAAGGPLDGRCGAGLDACFAERITLELAAGESTECVFLLGECASRSEALALVDRLRCAGAVEAALREARGFWERLVSGVQIETPSRELDLMVNGWLSYQTLACRIWGRTAFYQSGGAYGFRDQLQDASSLHMLRPDLTRRQILLHAAHQFSEGDVLHWWHPPLSKGIRTRFADDLLWLPYLVSGYVEATGDWSVLDELARFLKAPLLEPGEDEVFLVPGDSGQSADVYEHCCRAIDRSLDTGVHGLPLFGTGDWNDGMNRVGREGRGESVWMGFFLYAVLGDFAALCLRRGDEARVARYERCREQLRLALNDAGWDGEWYRRAYYDNGEPLGSRDSDECRIDGLAQAWAVLSGAAPPERAKQAMDAAERRLVSESDEIIRLLTPPFQNTPNDPGYIKGYVPGVRENGGQYTHAALWFVRAFAELGRNDRVAKLLTMLSPVSLTSDPEAVARYRSEPYAVVADVYGEPPHVGRGGWTWYTGSAGWMMRVALESLLGLRMEHGDTLVLRPCVPDDWPGFRVRWRIPDSETVYTIVANNPGGRAGRIVRASADGAPLEPHDGGVRVSLVRDGGEHLVELELGD